jgi:hypothetical protein
MLLVIVTLSKCSVDGGASYLTIIDSGAIASTHRKRVVPELFTRS